MKIELDYKPELIDLSNPNTSKTITPEEGGRRVQGWSVHDLLLSDKFSMGVLLVIKDGDRTGSIDEADEAVILLTSLARSILMVTGVLP